MHEILAAKLTELGYLAPGDVPRRAGPCSSGAGRLAAAYDSASRLRDCPRDEVARLQRSPPRPRGARDPARRSAEVDVVIGAGDFASVHQGLEEAIDALSAIEKPTVLVPGNNETEEALRAACKIWDAATVLPRGGHRDRRPPLLRAGGWCVRSPWDWSFDLDEQAAETKLAGAVPMGRSSSSTRLPTDTATRAAPVNTSAAPPSSRRSSGRSRGWRCTATSTSHGAPRARSARPRSSTSAPRAGCWRPDPGGRRGAARVRAVSAEIESPRAAEEWRVEVVLEGDDDNGQSLGESLHRLQLDDEARERLAGASSSPATATAWSLYAWHEESAREAERVVRELMGEDNLLGRGAAGAGTPPRTSGVPPISRCRRASGARRRGGGEHARAWEARWARVRRVCLGGGDRPSPT